MQRLRIVPGAVAICTLLAGLLLLGCQMPRFLTRGLFSRSEPVLVPTAADCERCHQEVYREWLGSRHAAAWTSSAFQAATAEGAAAQCTACHAAAPVEGGAPVRMRDVHVDEGVTCITCHLSPDPAAAPLTMRGPVSRTSPVQIHPTIERDPLYRSSELCGGCHQSAYAEWQAVEARHPDERRRTCQSCHMPEVRRKMESVHDQHAYSALFVALGDEVELRRHTFGIPEAATDEGLELHVGAAPLARDLSLRLWNRVPHDLPTGAFGRREVRLVARWARGERVESRSRRLGEALGSGEDWKVRFRLPEGVDPSVVEIRLERWDAGAADWQALLVRPPASSAAVKPSR